MASLILSIIGAIIGLIGLIPLLGIVNWGAIFVLLISLILGIVGINKHTPKAKAGLVISIIFLIIAVIRLAAGGGVL